MVKVPPVNTVVDTVQKLLCILVIPSGKVTSLVVLLLASCETVIVPLPGPAASLACPTINGRQSVALPRGNIARATPTPIVIPGALSLVKLPPYIQPLAEVRE